MTILKTSGLFYTRDGNTILNDINIEIDSGEFITVTGSSGSGKSTFLKMCGDLISPDMGNLFYKNKNYLEWNPYELRKKIAYLFQTPSFFFDSVYENMEYPFSLRKEPVNKERILELLNKVNLKEDILKQNIINLSGGEKQRLSLIRSLIFLPEVLLLDEITSALDYDNTLITEKLIKEISEQGVTIIWVTHDKDQSRKYANRILNFDSGKVKEEKL
ncbi:MAG: ATP-binding cassette domain-containing protein [Eubacteriales bacterium]|nr:ATP-binding cassette domain-containing protein [Eubacteriales bacterium]